MSLYKGFSNLLDRSWVVAADSVKEAAEISINRYLPLLNSLDEESIDDVDVDFRFERLQSGLLELP